MASERDRSRGRATSVPTEEKDVEAEEEDEIHKTRSFHCGLGVLKWYLIDGKPWTDSTHRSFTIYIFILGATWGCYSLSEAGHFIYSMLASTMLGVIMSIYAVPKIKNIIDMRHNLEALSKANKRLKKVQEGFQKDIGSVNKAHGKLDEIKKSINESNEKLKDSYANFSSFGNKLNRSNYQNIAGLKKLKYYFEECKRNYEALLTRSEKQILNTIYLRTHKNDGIPGLSLEEFLLFTQQLPDNYKQRFMPYNDTFHKYAGDDANMDYKEFQHMINCIARDEALGNF